MTTTTSLCKNVLNQLELVYGPPVTVGNLHRWAIPNHDPLNPIVLAVDECDDAFVKAWVFDVHQRINNGVIEFGIRTLQEVDSVLQKIHGVVQNLVTHRRDGDHGVEQQRS